MNDSLAVMIIGCGTMGSGIAQVAAVSGCRVLLFDAFEGAAARGRERIIAALAREVEKERMTAAAFDETAARLNVADGIEDCRQADIVIEAIRENLEEKQQLFEQLDGLVRPETLLLSNTSMISIAKIGERTRHPERIAGCHFFNPVPRMALVEVISGEKTSVATRDRVTEIVTSWGKVTIPAPDSPGFIVNRALLMLLNEAAFLAEEGNAPKDVDEAMKLGCNFPMGPLELMDLIGVDVVLDCQAALWQQFDRKPKYEPCPLLYKMVDEKKLGRKSGIGFYEYPSK